MRPVSPPVPVCLIIYTFLCLINNPYIVHTCILHFLFKFCLSLSYKKRREGIHWFGFIWNLLKVFKWSCGELLPLVITSGTLRFAPGSTTATYLSYARARIIVSLKVKTLITTHCGRHFDFTFMTTETDLVKERAAYMALQNLLLLKLTCCAYDDMPYAYI